MNKSKAIKINKYNRDLLREFISLLEKEEKCSMFIDYMDWKKLMLNDYKKVVPYQKYLNLVVRKLDRYINLSDFIYDIRMIWKNNKSYFGVNSDIYKNADYMEKLANFHLEKLKRKMENLSAEKEEFNISTFSCDTRSTIDEKSLQLDYLNEKNTICQEEKNFIKIQLKKLSPEKLSQFSSFFLNLVEIIRNEFPSLIRINNKMLYLDMNLVLKDEYMELLE